MHLVSKILWVMVLYFITNNNSVLAQSLGRKKYVLPADTILHKVNARPIARKIIRLKPLMREMAFGYTHTSIGSYLGFRRYKADDEFLTYKGLYVNVGQIKSNKEIKITGIKNLNEPNISPGAFTYGKINNLLNLQIGYSYRKKITGYLENSNVLIHGFGDVGISLGFLKPYYLKLARSNSSGGFSGVDEKYSDTTAVFFLDKSNIFGKSPFSVGLNEMKLRPDVNLKTGLQFEYLPTKHAGALVELGFQVDMFAQKQIILVKEPASQIFPGAFVALKYGIKMN